MCIACTPTLDPERTEAFAGRMLELVNGGALALMISIGHRTGLFDAMAGQSAAIARARREAKSPNVQFSVQDAAGIDEPKRYDLITAFDANHDQAEAMLADAGFARVDVHEMPHDIMNFRYVAQP